MEDEWFDVVDGEDRVVGRERRAEVHRKKLLHRAVHLFVFNRAGHIFLQKRSMSKDVAPGRWDSSCSGHLDAGEDYDAAVVREAFEEIGMKLESVPERVRYFKAGPGTGMEFVWLYKAESEGPFSLHPEEIETGAWFSPGSVDRWIEERPKELAGSFRYIWKQAR